mgnify:CR=1 FL=1
MNETKCRAGKPPHIGYWNCMDPWTEGTPEWRWWNGRAWGATCFRTHSAYSAARAARAAKNTPLNYPVYSSSYYPTNARVPRVKP